MTPQPWGHAAYPSATASYNQMVITPVLRIITTTDDHVVNASIEILCNGDFQIHRKAVFPHVATSATGCRCEGCQLRHFAPRPPPCGLKCWRGEDEGGCCSVPRENASSCMRAEWV
eukprot:1394513-Pleurochrysis_carterae.AAC.1